MAFAIMRAVKLKGMGSVASSLQHCYRERDTPNADASQTPDNEHHAARSTDEAMGKLRELLPEKRRKDAVLAVEYVMTASPEWWKSANQEQQADFFTRSKQWLADKYGADRIITASIHRDEASPHLSAFVVPLTQDSRLSAKEFIGDRKKMTADQTSFAARVADLGLERGIERSRAKHQTIRAHYAAIERGQVSRVTITPEALEPRKYKAEGMAEKLGLSKRVESQETIAARLTAYVAKAYEPVAAKAAVSAQNERRSDELQKTLSSQRERLKSLSAPFEGLTRDQMRGLIVEAQRLKLENEAAKAAKVEHQREQRQQNRERGGGGRGR